MLPSVIPYSMGSAGTKLPNLSWYQPLEANRLAGNFNLACSLYRYSISSPDALAVVCQGTSLSYGELAQHAARLAHCLTGSSHPFHLQEQPLRVGILASRSIEACIAVLGACWAGATYVPVNTKQPEERILALITQCSLSAIVTDDEGVKLLSPGLRAACPPLIIHAGQQSIAPLDSGRAVIKLADLPLAAMEEPAHMMASDIAYIIFTSGTTGIPKGVMIPAGAVHHYLATIAGKLVLRRDDRVLETCELGFDFSVHNMFSTWEAGAALCILPATLVMNAVKFARSTGLTVWNSVPSLAGMLRQVKALTPDSLATLRITVFGGEQLPKATIDAWQKAAPASLIFNLYGPTEATVFCLAEQISGPLSITPGRDVLAIGMPLPGNEAQIIDADGNALPEGLVGELLIGGEQLAAGYLGSPELTATRFPIRDGRRWYRTGDLAMRDATGRFHCLGRMDNQVKVFGYRIELEEIDAQLRVVAGVDLVGSVAWPLVDGTGRGIVGFVGMPEVNSGSIIKVLKNRLPAYMVPTRIIAMQNLPLSTSGKVDRQALRKLLENEQS
jgi:D-alanine--poly(phosphoribitol) ligase subunit 1